ncbi:hypothetical protein M422DRAFT_57555 [Sphaerobolus stellatus SS14]|nr:hypothetical protein M422DRAFT_57555 [Sphaerobolus stellatus SS14]
MAASSADIRDILSLPNPNHPAGPSNAPGAGPSAPPPPPQQKKAPKHTKPEGISRELYSLIGDNAPSLAAVQRAKVKMRAKPDLGRGKVRWEWRSFTNGARDDGLKLGHWEKIKAEQPVDYPFAKYNTSTNVYSYTAEEYETLLKDDEWTKEETDYLFSLVKEYDMRWYVIFDRYEFPAGEGEAVVERQLEDLKARYYSVCRKLIRSRPWAGEEAQRTTLINSYLFDKDRERTRKKYVSSLFARTPEQIAEEDALYLEIKKLEQTERRFAKEREELMKTVAGIESGLNVHQPDEEAFAGLFIDPRKKKKIGEGESPGPSTPGAGSVAGGSAVVNVTPAKRVISAKQAAEDARNCIIRTEVTTNLTSTKSSHQLAHLRSTKIPWPKASVAQRVNTLTGEMGVNANRLVMPTLNNIQLLDGVLEAATLLAETKKVVDRLDQEIRTQKKLLGLLKDDEEGGQGQSVSGSVAGGEGTVGETMEVDREASVVVLDGEGSTTRQPNHKRSLSISSVETSATGVTRASRNNKRMKKA